jgi:DNA-binding transcriptional ArsR family regulator
VTLAIGTTLSALADETRRSAVEALADGRLSAGELSARLGVTPASLTRHLRLLRKAGLVTVSLDAADSRRHIYSLEPVSLTELTHWAENLARFWTTQLDSYAQLTTKDRDARG